MQLDGNVSRTRIHPPSAILPNIASMRSSWSTPVDSRSIDAGFFGVGLPHLGVEALIAMLNKLLVHYGCDTATGQFMPVSYSLFYLELGLLFQPMQESYQKYSTFVTHLWMKMLWKKTLMFELHTVVADVPSPFNFHGKGISS